MPGITGEYNNQQILIIVVAPIVIYIMFVNLSANSSLIIYWIKQESILSRERIKI